MRRVPKIVLSAWLATAPALAAAQQQGLAVPVESTLPAPAYADIADLVVAAPTIVDAVIRSAIRLKPAAAPGVSPGIARLYIEADVQALIRGTGAVPPRIAYTYDAPLDARGKPPRYRKARVLLFARPAAGDGAQVQLIRPDAQRGWTPAADALARRIVREVLAPDAPPAITGIGNAAHSSGALPGEGETQIFLLTPGGQPISLSVVSKPDTPKSWSIALSEVVGQGAPPPARDTLLWYRLACALPPTLPADAASGADAEADAAREDYAFVVQTLGPCDRGTP